MINTADTNLSIEESKPTPHIIRITAPEIWGGMSEIDIAGVRDCHGVLLSARRANSLTHAEAAVAWGTRIASGALIDTVDLTSAANRQYAPVIAALEDECGARYTPHKPITWPPELEPADGDDDDREAALLLLERVPRDLDSIFLKHTENDSPNRTEELLAELRWYAQYYPVTVREWLADLRDRLVEAAAEAGLVPAGDPAADEQPESAHADAPQPVAEHPVEQVPAAPGAPAAPVTPDAAKTVAAEAPKYKAPPLPGLMRLIDRHTEQLRESLLDDAILVRANVYSSTSCEATGRLLGYSGSSPKTRGAALVFPCFRPGETQPHAYRAKFDNPKKDAKGKPQKYTQPADIGLLVYYGPNARRDNGAALKDAGRDLVFVEGEKKALFLERLGFAVVGITGVTSWHDKPHKDATGGEYILHKDIRDYCTVEGRRCVIVFDADSHADAKKPQIMECARLLAAVLLKAGAREVVFIAPPYGKSLPKGIDDYAYAHSEKGAKPEQGLEAARLLIGGAGHIEPAESTWYRNAKTGKNQILVEFDEEEVRNQALEILTKKDDRLYQSAGALSYVIRDAWDSGKVVMPDGETSSGYRRDRRIPRISRLPKTQLRTWLSHHCEFVREKEGEDGETEFKQISVPVWVAGSVAEMGSWPGVRTLAAVVDRPVLRPDGTLLTQSGYDEMTALLYEPRTDITYPDIASEPTLDDAIRARETLENVVCDFPFEGPAHRSAWLAWVLTIVARYSFYGPTPMFLADAPTPGSGKTLLIDVGTIIATGYPSPRWQYSPGDEAENRKQLTTVAIAAPSCVLADNVKGVLGGAALEEQLISTTRDDRILGGNTSYNGPWSTVMAGTANNANLTSDMTRRVIYMRLVPAVERPETRTGFRVADLEAWTYRHHPELLAAVLTILSAYAAAGRPPVELAPYGSYESWSSAVRAPLVWCGATDPLEACKALARSSSEQEDIHSLIVEMAKLTAIRGPLHAADILTAASSDGWIALREAIAALSPQAARRESVTSRGLGHLLAKLRGRVADSCQLRGVDDGHGSTLWASVRLG